MIVVDSSVWINHFRDRPSPQVSLFRTMLPDGILVGDIIVLEVLRGLSSERDAVTLQRKFEAYGITQTLDPELALLGAAHYRALRRRGITVRTLADLAIATFCIERGHNLLHQDRDFDHFERHLGLKVWRAAA